MVPQESKKQPREGMRWPYKLKIPSFTHLPPLPEHLHQSARARNSGRSSRRFSFPSRHADGVSFPSYHFHVVSLPPCNEDVLNVQRLTEQRIRPTSAHEDDAGLDLYASAPVSNPPWSKALIPTDLAIPGPPGTYARIAVRSGLALKHSLHVLRGVVDRSCRGNVRVTLYNGSSMPYEVQQGDKISQFILERFIKPPIVLLDELPSSDRGTSGFSSSGTSMQHTTKAGRNHITILIHQISQHTHPSIFLNVLNRINLFWG